MPGICEHGNEVADPLRPFPPLPSPCCYLCWKAGRPTPPLPPVARSLPCVHDDGNILTFCPRGDESLNVRGCAIHDQMTWQKCRTCGDYSPDRPASDIPVADGAGIVVGHYGLPGLGRLQVEAIRRHCGDVPILLADDGSSRDAEFEAIADANPNVTFWPSTERLGHYAGDLSVFWKGLQWAHHNRIRWLCKLSQRFLWLRPNWLAVARDRLKASGQATLMQACVDNGVNLFVRSECMMLDAEKWLPHLAQFSDRQLVNPTEFRIWHLIHTHFDGRYGEWAELPVNRYEQADGSLWHGSNAVQPYADLAAQYGLSLDPDFNTGGWEHQEGWLRG